MTKKTKPEAKPAPVASATEIEAIDRLRLAVVDLTATLEFVGLHLAAQISNLPSE